MDDQSLKYKIKTASPDGIYLHLKECNDRFIPALDRKVDLQEYSKKIFERSTTFEAWFDIKLVGLIAAYFNDTENYFGYITSVSVISNFKGKGIASELMKRCIGYAQQHNFFQIELEVGKRNGQAIQLYKKFNFVVISEKDDMVSMRLQIANTNE